MSLLLLPTHWMIWRKERLISVVVSLAMTLYTNLSESYSDPNACGSKHIRRPDDDATSILLNMCIVPAAGDFNGGVESIRSVAGGRLFHNCKAHFLLKLCFNFQ